MSFTESVFPWGHAGDFWITIQAFDRNLYGKEARMAHSALRKYVSLERTVLMGAFHIFYLSFSRGASSPTDPRVGRPRIA